MPKPFTFQPGSKIHLVGIGGIGMSGLAQMLNWMGFRVSGSDRDISKPENSAVFKSLRGQGIRLFPQDGAFAGKIRPDALVYSTAIEKDNPDFSAAPDIPRIHRADAVSAAVSQLKNAVSIAVTGTCGKTTVTAWIAETLRRLGHDPVVLAGGFINSFKTAKFAGNFRPGRGKYFVYEADESDKSLLSCRPDYALVLNAGTDHYPLPELYRVFSEFVSGTKCAAVVEDEVFRGIGGKLPEKTRIFTFGEKSRGCVEKNDCVLSKYEKGTSPKAHIGFADGKSAEVELPVPGFHNAMNAAAVMALLHALGIKTGRKTAAAVSAFSGVSRRFEFKGRMGSGAKIYDDYAHNAEKIASCIRTAGEICAGKVVAVFQPHGFAPLRFMRRRLFMDLEKSLRNRDVFIFLPVFYAGGTASFKPTSENVAASFAKRGSRKYLYFDSRTDAEKFLAGNARAKDVVLIMGARDNSLSVWAKSL